MQYIASSVWTFMSMRNVHPERKNSDTASKPECERPTLRLAPRH